VPDAYDKDDVAKKADARRMIRLVQHMHAKSGEYGIEPSRISCWLCHRGSPEPAAPGAE
jgi:hypothetical protein